MITKRYYWGVIYVTLTMEQTVLGAKRAKRTKRAKRWGKKGQLDKNRDMITFLSSSLHITTIIFLPWAFLVKILIISEPKKSKNNLLTMIIFQ